MVAQADFVFVFMTTVELAVCLAHTIMHHDLTCLNILHQYAEFLNISCTFFSFYSNMQKLFLPFDALILFF